MRVLIFEKQPSAHTEFSIRKDIFKFHETEGEADIACLLPVEGEEEGGVG